MNEYHIQFHTRISVATAAVLFPTLLWTFSIFQVSAMIALQALKSWKEKSKDRCIYSHENYLIWITLWSPNHCQNTEKDNGQLHLEIDSSKLTELKLWNENCSESKYPLRLFFLLSSGFPDWIIRISKVFENWTCRGKLFPRLKQSQNAPEQQIVMEFIRN